MVSKVIPVPFYDLGQLVRTYANDLHSCLDEVIDGGYFVGGELPKRFEDQFGSFVGSDHCVGTGNGLDALRMILEAYDVGPGDEVIVPAFTFFATWLAVTQVGAVPVPVDVESTSGNIDPGLIRAAITARTKVILPVHLYGRPANMAAILQVANEHGLIVVEDAAQGHAARTAEGRTGSLGHAAAFSFYPTKNLGALGDAGCVTTSDSAVADRIRSRRSYGQGTSKYEHVDTGWNSRLDPFQASILSLHLTHLEDWTKRRRSIAGQYSDALRGSPALLGSADIEGSVWHHAVLKSTDRVALQEHFRKLGVSTDIHYPYWIGSVAPMRGFLKSPALQEDFPSASALSAQVLSLPIGPWMTDGQVASVVDALNGVPHALLVG